MKSPIRVSLLAVALCLFAIGGSGGRTARRLRPRHRADRQRQQLRGDRDRRRRPRAGWPESARGRLSPGAGKGLARALGQDQRQAARPGAVAERFPARQYGLGNRRRAGAGRAAPLYRDARRAVRPRAHQRRARRRRHRPSFRADAGHPGDADRLDLHQLRISQSAGRRPGRASAPATARSTMSARSATASILCCSTRRRRTGPAAPGGGRSSINMALRTSSFPRCISSGSGPAARSSASSSPARGRTIRCSAASRCASKTARPFPRLLDEGVRRLDAIYAAALDTGQLKPDATLAPPPPPPVVATPEEQPTEAPALETTPTPTAQTTTTFSVQVDTPDAAAVSRAELAASRVPGVHLGDHHQPRARRDVGDAGHLPGRFRRLSRRRSRRRAGRCAAPATTLRITKSGGD